MREKEASEISEELVLVAWQSSKAAGFTFVDYILS